MQARIIPPSPGPFTPAKYEKTIIRDANGTNVLSVHGTNEQAVSTAEWVLEAMNIRHELENAPEGSNIAILWEDLRRAIEASQQAAQEAA